MYGKLIKAILKKYDIKQSQLAKELTFSESFMSQLVNDKAPIPKNRQIILQEKYKVNPVYLLTLKGSMFMDEETEEDEELSKELQECAELIKTRPELLSEVLDVIIKDPDIMSIAVKTIKGDKIARERFLKLTQ